MMEDGFNIPVVLFIFKREKVLEILSRLSRIRPRKLYILADQGRDEGEKRAAEACRKKVEAAITWPCEVIKNYAEENRGVYKNIGLGARWVFEREERAIFLEDDNLPELSFFSFCEEMLDRYQDDTRVLWVCGTNYLGDFTPSDGKSYVFTRHMLPCGWASWGNKFNRFYDGELRLCENPNVVESVRDLYYNKKLYRQYRRCWMGEYERMRNGNNPISWDYQMDFSLKANNLFGICPCKNQIKNIGVDENSIHGGSSANVMVERFCGMESYPLHFPLNHPDSLVVNDEFENRIGKIILYPFKSRIKDDIAEIIRRILHIPYSTKIKRYIKEELKK